MFVLTLEAHSMSGIKCFGYSLDETDLSALRGRIRRLKSERPEHDPKQMFYNNDHIIPTGTTITAQPINNLATSIYLTVSYHAGVQSDADIRANTTICVVEYWLSHCLFKK